MGLDSYEDMIADAEAYDAEDYDYGAGADYLDGEDDDYVYGVDSGGDGGSGDGAGVGAAASGDEESGVNYAVPECPGKRRRIDTVTRWSASARAAMVRELGEGVT